RFAPGFRDLVLARAVTAPRDFEARNRNLVGGDVNGGTMDLGQLVTRPVRRLNPYPTPLPGLYLCSSATPPGGGVHGMCGYSAAARAVIERHGGTVEKFIGDAVMAVFGIPVMHEDDALRAARTALELRTALTWLSGELDRDFGITLEAHIGINSGEVLAGDASRREAFVAGDVVNVAKRLQENAGTGEILIGGETYRLARDAVVV